LDSTPSTSKLAERSESASVLVQQHELIMVLGDQGTAAVEIAALGNPSFTNSSEPCREEGWLSIRPGVQDRVQIPVRGAPEGDAFPLPINDQPGRDRLHPSGRQPRHDLLPQHGRDLIAVQTIKDPPGLLGIDEILVKITGVGDRLGNGCLSDLMEDHAFRRDLGLELLQQMPGDGLALTVAVCGEQQFDGTCQCVLERADRGPLLRVDDVEGLEAVVHVHAGASPLLTLVFRGDFGGTSREVANVTAAGLDDVAVAQKTRDLVRLGRGLDDHESPAPCLRCHRILTFSFDVITCAAKH
jgi:hypothetical protein